MRVQLGALVLIGCAEPAATSFTFELSVEPTIPNEVITIDGDPAFPTTSWTFDSVEQAQAALRLSGVVTYGDQRGETLIQPGYCLDELTRAPYPAIDPRDLGDLVSESITLDSTSTLRLQPLRWLCVGTRREYGGGD